MDVIKKVKEKYNEFMLDTNCINRLLTDKVDDYIIIEEQPMPIKIGNKVILIGNFTYENELTFFKGWGLLISVLCARIINFELSKVRKKELLEKADFEMLANGKWMLEFLLMDKWLKKKICKLLKKTLFKQQAYILNKKTRQKKLKKWTNCNYGYFKKHVTKEALIQICWLIYLYNFDSQKKSLRLVVEKMNMHALMETYIPFWLQNLGGLTGRFHDAPLPNIDFLSDGSANKKNMLQKKEGKTNG